MKPGGASGRDALPEGDLINLLRASEGAVLVGGQALAFWVVYFGIGIAPRPRAFISVDADFLGAAWHVERFAKAIGGRALHRSRREMTALHGVVVRQTTSGERIEIDVLRAIVGLDVDEVRKRALNVRHLDDPSVQFMVMNPIDCMISRLENLRKVAAKRNEIGIWQARLSLAVCRSYVESIIAANEERKAIRAATRILEIAGTAPGLQAFHKYRLDLIETIPIVAFTSSSFRDRQYSRTATRIRQLRDAYKGAARFRAH